MGLSGECGKGFWRMRFIGTRHG